MVVFWLSRHGDGGLNGTKQYPSTTIAQRQAYWQQIEGVFEGKLVDSSHGALNQVTMAEHWSTGAQVVVYASDYKEFTGSSTKAIDAMHIDNQLGGSSITNIPGGITGGIGCFSAGTRVSDKAKNSFYLVSMASSGPQVGEAAEYKYVPGAKQAAVKACAKLFHIPNMTGCPLTLMDVGTLGNYYNQQTLEFVYKQMEADPHGDKYEFPNAIYIDGIDAGGTLRTGPAHICGVGADCSTSLPVPPPSTQHAAEAYAYAATVVGTNLLRLCPNTTLAATHGHGAGVGVSSTCATGKAAINGLRAKHPLALWDDEEHGRVSLPPSSWPKH